MHARHDPFAVVIEDDDVDGRKAIRLTYGGVSRDFMLADLEAKVIAELTARPQGTRDLRTAVGGAKDLVDSAVTRLSDRGAIYRENLKAKWRVNPMNGN